MFHGLNIFYAVKHYYICSVEQNGNNMETLTEFTNVFGNGFFPIIVCGIMFYLFAKQLTELKKSIDENTKNLRELITLIKTI